VTAGHANPLDEIFIDWLTRVCPSAHQLGDDQRDLMEMTFYAGAALSFGCAEQHGAEVVLDGIRAHVVRLEHMSRRAAVQRHDWRAGLHKRIDRMAMEAHVGINLRARQIRLELGLPERP
jgi:hypothetical protein